jgi:hypothetical protein|tara:strand:- start:2952 stop:4346 length:1395 start_codon:yes stop_codon:yes gene_type:complete
MDFRREVLQIQPTNLGSGVFGARNGLPQVIFEIPRVPKIMDGKSLRINGTMTCLASEGQPPQNATNFFVAAAPVNDVYIDGRTGISSVIDTLSIQNLEGATYETIKNYNRMCSSLSPLNESVENYLNGGVDGLYGGLSKEVSTAKKSDNKFEFSLPLLAGFLAGSGGIDLQLIKGCRIIITLAPDNFVMRNNYWRNTNSAGGTTAGGAYYELSNMSLSVTCETPDEAGQNAMIANRQGSWDYDAYSSFYNVIQSNDHNATININTGRTISTIMNIVPSKFLNNYEYNSQWTSQLLTENGAGVLKNRVVMTDLTFTKGGLRIPLDFEVDSQASQTSGVSTSFKNFEELNAIRNVWSLSNFEKSLTTELSLPLGNAVAGGAAYEQARFSLVNGYSMNFEDKIQQYNLGVSYDHITYNGLDFRGTPLGLRIQSVAPTGTSLKPHSLFLFVKHKNTIVFQDGQVRVIM